MVFACVPLEILFCSNVIDEAWFLDCVGVLCRLDEHRLAAHRCVKDVCANPCGEDVSMASDEVKVPPDEFWVVCAACADNAKSGFFIGFVFASDEVVREGANANGLISSRQLLQPPNDCFVADIIIECWRAVAQKEEGPFSVDLLALHACHCVEAC